MKVHDIVSYGLHIRVECAVASLDEALEARLPPLHDPGIRSAEVDRSYRIEDSGTTELTLAVDGAPVLRAANPEELLDYFESDLDLFVAVHARDHIFVHAGVVGVKGQAIVLPGRSFSGKTSLVVEFLRAGASFYSDENAVVDAMGRIHPFHRPLRVRAANGTRLRQGPGAFGARPGHTPLTVGQIVFARHVPGATWAPQTLRPAEAALGLLANTPCARTRPEEAMAHFAHLCAGVCALDGERGEARLVVEALLADM